MAGGMSSNIVAVVLIGLLLWGFYNVFAGESINIRSLSGLIGFGALGLLALGVRIIRPIERGLVERLGKYNRYAEPGFHWIVPFIEKIVRVNITERLADAQPQEIITKDNLNAKVDAQVYFKVKGDEPNVKASQYYVSSYAFQIVSLARTTLRNIIGTLTLKEANSERDRINNELMKVLKTETANWGIEIVRTELKEIEPPRDVQETMNKVVKAENEKISAIDFATAAETKADGEKRAAIKAAEGERQSEILLAEGKKQAEILAAEGDKQARILRSEGEAEAIRLVNEAAQRYFTGNAQILKRLEVVEESLRANAKVVIPAGAELVNVIGELAGVVPVGAKGSNQK